MFYQGDLQSGINKALQQSKYVACFVTGKCYVDQAVRVTDKSNQMGARRAVSGKKIISQIRP